MDLKPHFEATCRFFTHRQCQCRSYCAYWAASELLAATRTRSTDSPILSTYERELLADITANPSSLYTQLDCNAGPDAAEALANLLAAGLVRRLDTGKGIRFEVMPPLSATPEPQRADPLGALASVEQIFDGKIIYGQLYTYLGQHPEVWAQPVLVQVQTDFISPGPMYPVGMYPYGYADGERILCHKPEDGEYEPLTREDFRGDPDVRPVYPLLNNALILHVEPEEDDSAADWLQSLPRPVVPEPPHTPPSPPTPLFG
jgi:hypothetical protein